MQSFRLIQEFESSWHGIQTQSSSCSLPFPSLPTTTAPSFPTSYKPKGTRGKEGKMPNGNLQLYKPFSAGIIRCQKSHFWKSSYSCEKGSRFLFYFIHSRLLDPSCCALPFWWWRGKGAPFCFPLCHPLLFCCFLIFKKKKKKNLMGEALPWCLPLGWNWSMGSQGDRTSLERWCHYGRLNACRCPLDSSLQL